MQRLILVVLVAGAAFAQTAQITGRVTDSSQAVVPDTQITVTSTATTVAHKTASNSAGIYTVPLLPIGTYSVLVENRDSARSGAKG